ncbi:MAG TPA: hypothetical protein VFR93_02160 [Candidatus Limnocylindrales bacterium]|nr:hypothetical protein [Candidatus Limnocylindrales bacterium]
MTYPVSATDFTTAVPNSLDTDALQRLLDAAQEAIDTRIGALYSVGSGDEQGQAREILTVHGDLLLLSRRALSIDEVIEGHFTPTTLAANDYELLPDGQTLRRLATGTHVAYRWAHRVNVLYTPLSDVASRELAQINLVRLELTFNPALKAYTTGNDSETYVEGKSYAELREDILDSLVPAFAGIF